MSAAPTAYWPAPRLLTSLARAGWGDLDTRTHQGVRTVLRALVDSLPHQSAEGYVTEPQIAQRAGLSLRWVRRCLHVLEDLGVIVDWRRGGISNGAPVPSWLRLSKAALVALIEAARPRREAADAERRARTAERVGHVLHMRRSRRSGHAALDADLPTPTGEVSTSPPRNGLFRTRKTRKEDDMARIRRMDEVFTPEHLTMLNSMQCQHGAEHARLCALCKRTLRDLKRGKPITS